MAKRKTVTFNNKVEVRYYDKESVIDDINKTNMLFRPSTLILVTIMVIGLYHILR